MKINLFLLSGVVLVSQSVMAQQLPIVSIDQMKLGNHWTWTYYTNGDLNRFYSAEKYQVIDATGSLVTFEMSSRYDDHSDFKPHTRFQVNLTHCMDAFKNPKAKVNFWIALFPKLNGVWEKNPISTSSTAFEEKFNCNPVLHTKRNSPYETRFETLETEGVKERLFQQWPKTSLSQIRSFYFMNRTGLEGVAFRKEFSPGTPYFYEMRLTDWGNSAI